MVTTPISKSQETLRPTLRKTSRTSIEKLISDIFKELESKPKSDQCLYSHNQNNYNEDEDSEPSYRFPTRRPKTTTRKERRALKAMHTWTWDTGFAHAMQRTIETKMEILNLVGPKDEVVEFEVFNEENVLGEKVVLSVLSVRKTGEKEKTGRVVSSKWKWRNSGKGSCLEVDKQGLRRSEEPVQVVVP